MNKIMLIGIVGKEPEVRYFEADQAVATVILATTERGYTLQNGTTVPDQTDWHTIIFRRQLAKIVEQYLHKGDKLYVEGRVRYRSFDDKRGQRRYVTEIWAENMEFLTPKNHSQQTTTTQVNDTTAQQRNADSPFHSGNDQVDPNVAPF